MAVPNSATGPGSASPWGMRSRVNTPALVAITCVGILLCLWLAIPFLPSLTWTITLVILFLPIHRRIESVLKKPNLAATASVIIVALIIVLPLSLVIRQLLIQATSGIATLNEKLENGALEQTLNSDPRVLRASLWLVNKINVEEAMRNAAAWLTQTGAAFLKGSVTGIIKLCVTFYLFFYIIRDRGLAIRSLRTLSPLSRREMDLLFRRVGDTVYATIFGTLTVATVQGLLGGLMFWWLGLPTPMLWGIVMAMLAIIPVLGPFVIWIPAALLLVVDGEWIKALLLIAWGALVVGTIDNFLGPVLMGKRLRLHPVNIFVSLVGALIFFGAPGLILGPVLLASTIALLEIWHDRTESGPPDLGVTPHGKDPVSRLV
jgi:predicted PurR-regulated permease PerM